MHSEIIPRLMYIHGYYTRKHKILQRNHFELEAMRGDVRYRTSAYSCKINNERSMEVTIFSNYNKVCSFALGSHRRSSIYVSSEDEFYLYHNPNSTSLAISVDNNPQEKYLSLTEDEKFQLSIIYPFMGFFEYKFPYRLDGITITSECIDALDEIIYENNIKEYIL